MLASSASTCRHRWASRSFRAVSRTLRANALSHNSHRSHPICISPPGDPMTFQSKRSMIKLAGLGSIAAAAALVGCGKKEEAPTAAAPASAAPMAASAPAKAEPLKIAFAYVGPVGDGGWTFAHDNARKAVEKAYGDKVVTSFVEKVPESADAERVIRDMANNGAKLIFGTTFGYMEPMLKVAADTK